MRKICSRNIRKFFENAFSSITILVIPHDGCKFLNVKIPAIALVLSILLPAIGGGFLIGLAISGLEYKAEHRAMAEKLRFYSEQFYQWNSTLTGLKRVESTFRRLFTSKSKDEVLQYADTSSLASLEIPDLTVDLKKTIEKVREIQIFLRTQKDIYLSTPAGYPVPGNITSQFGPRPDPMDGELAFHSGVDISIGAGSAIRATAEGIVSHSGWRDGSGFVVVLEHGCGFSTIYAHNETNAVKVGQKVKRGGIIGYVGSTGKSTGPHVHYEVWKNGKALDPRKFLFQRT